MPLRVRLALWFAAATGGLIAAASIPFTLQLGTSLEDALDPGLRSHALTVAGELANDGVAAAVTALPGIVQIQRPDGGLLASSSDAGPTALLTAAQRRQAMAGEVSVTTTVHGDRNRLLARAASVVGGGSALVVVGTGTDVAEAAVGNVRTALLAGGPPAVLLAGLGAWLLAGAALRPVERMRRQAAAMGEGDPTARLPVPATRDEIAALGNTMNDLLDRLHQALQRQRGFVADAGHELRTPLAILRTELELAARPGRDRAALARAVGAAGEETDRLIRLTEDLLLLARTDNAQPVLNRQDVRLDELLRTATDRAGTVIELRCPDGLRVDADPVRLRQVVDNLLDNAQRHAPAGSAVTVTATRSADGVEIEVCDSGPGFPPEFLPSAFERFQRADAARGRDDGGTGLGLAIVRALVEAHGGHVDADNQPGGGARVWLTLPAST